MVGHLKPRGLGVSLAASRGRETFYRQHTLEIDMATAMGILGERREHLCYGWMGSCWRVRPGGEGTSCALSVCLSALCFNGKSLWLLQIRDWMERQGSWRSSPGQGTMQS